jgi:hypothetical protein
MTTPNNPTAPTPDPSGGEARPNSFAPRPEQQGPYGGIFDDYNRQISDGSARITTPWMQEAPTEPHSKPRDWAESTIGKKSIGHRAISALVDSGPLGVPVDIVRGFRRKQTRPTSEQQREEPLETLATRRLRADVAYQQRHHDSRIDASMAADARERAMQEKNQERMAQEGDRQRQAELLRTAGPEFSDPQALLDLSVSLDRSVASGLAEKEREKGSELNDVEKDRLKYGLREDFMRDRLGPLYNEELSGVVRNSMLAAIKRYAGSAAGPNTRSSRGTTTRQPSPTPSPDAGRQERRRAPRVVIPMS